LTYIPRFGRVGTEAKAGYISSIDEYQPLIRTLAAGGLQDILIVLQGQVRNLCLDDLAGGSLNRLAGSGSGGGDVGRGCAEPALDLFGQWDLGLLGERERGQRKEERGGETHSGREARKFEGEMVWGRLRRSEQAGR